MFNPLIYLKDILDLSKPMKKQSQIEIKKGNNIRVQETPKHDWKRKSSVDSNCTNSDSETEVSLLKKSLSTGIDSEEKSLESLALSTILNFDDGFSNTVFKQRLTGIQRLAMRYLPDTAFESTVCREAKVIQKSKEIKQSRKESLIHSIIEPIKNIKQSSKLTPNLNLPNYTKVQNTQTNTDLSKKNFTIDLKLNLEHIRQF